MSQPIAILQRKIANSDAADLTVPRNNIGELFRKVNDKFEWFSYTLEDEIRMDGVKVPGQTCVEAGDYDMTVTMSTRFKREMVLLTPRFIPTVKFSGLRMHGGNTEEDTEGCLLVANNVNAEKTRIYGSMEKGWTSWVKSIGGGILRIENKQLSSNDILSKQLI